MPSFFCIANLAQEYISIIYPKSEPLGRCDIWNIELLEALSQAFSYDCFMLFMGKSGAGWLSRML
jgi:hypothetical protein